MKWLLWLFLVASAFGQTAVMGSFTVAKLPAAANAGRLAFVTDGNSVTDCAAGTGSIVVLCKDSGAAWAAVATPNLGVATATSINKVAITAPATSATLTIADGKTLTASNTVTLTGTDGASLNLSNAVTAASNYTSGQFVKAAGNDKTTSSAAIVATDLPAALANSTSVNGTTIPSSATLPTLIAAGTAAMGTAEVASGACATVVTDGTVTAGAVANVLTTDVIQATPAADPTGVTGYAVSATGSLYIQAYPTAGHVNFKVCNNTSGGLTPSALTLNWRVTR